MIVIKPKDNEFRESNRLNEVLNYSLLGIEYTLIESDTDLLDKIEILKNNKIIFAVNLGNTGINITLFKILRILREKDKLLDNSICGVIVDEMDDLYTKAIGQDIIFTLNKAGAIVPGKSLIEGTKKLYNFTILAQNYNKELFETYKYQSKAMIDRLLKLNIKKLKKERPKLLCVHASNSDTSNTYSLWKMVKDKLEDIDIREINIRNGEVYDCIGCPFETCMHFSEEGSCFYGGVIVDEVYPAVEWCDGIVLVCPNYNDALSANLQAFINRLTSLYRKTSFCNKFLFSIIVSGYSGSDILAKQLISSMNINKGFLLPSEFAMLETANNKGEIFKVTGIDKRTENYAKKIERYLKV